MVPSNCCVADGVDVGGDGVIISIRLNSLCFPRRPVVCCCAIWWTLSMALVDGDTFAVFRFSVTPLLSSMRTQATQARNATITYIRAMDQYVNGKGGYATLRAGGVGFNHTEVRFKSQRSQGIDFILEIYGH
uniref:Putative transcription activator mbf2 n=1 Tax=Lutzomyia longipalpis TaxID=7200 RepID=A0A1B0GJR7_LUTLO